MTWPKLYGLCPIMNSVLKSSELPWCLQSELPNQNGISKSASLEEIIKGKFQA